MQVLPGFGHGGGQEEGRAGCGQGGHWLHCGGHRRRCHEEGGQRGHGQVFPALGLTRLGQAAG